MKSAIILATIFNAVTFMGIAHAYNPFAPNWHLVNTADNTVWDRYHYKDSCITAIYIYARAGMRMECEWRS